MAIDFDIREPKNQRLIAVIMTVAVALYGYYQFMVKPKRAEIAVRTTEVVTLRNQINTMRGNLQARKVLDAEQMELGARLAELEASLPDREDVSSLLDQFSMVENEAKVYVIGFKASDTVDETDQPYQANRYKVTIEAGFHQYMEFMAGIMALERILSFSELKIGVNPNAPAGEDLNEGLEDQPRSLSIECSITSYTFRDLGDNPAGVKGKKI